MTKRFTRCSSLMLVAAFIVFWTGMLFSRETDIPSREYVVGKTFTASHYILMALIFQARLSFADDGRYEMEYNPFERNGWHVRGNFVFSEGKIKLIPDPDDEKPNPKFQRKPPIKNAECLLNISSTSLDYTHFLKVISTDPETSLPKYNDEQTITQLVFEIREEKVAPGLERAISGRTVITTGMKIAATKNKASFMLEPQFDAQSVDYYPSAWSFGGKQKTIPDGTKIVLVARTLHKDTFMKTQDYWYLVRTEIQKNFWIFGSYISIEKEK
jgi:hypothetical protein